jgi:hypothetical protein
MDQELFPVDYAAFNNEDTEDQVRQALLNADPVRDSFADGDFDEYNEFEAFDHGAPPNADQPISNNGHASSLDFLPPEIRGSFPSSLNRVQTDCCPAVYHVCVRSPF